MAMTWEKLYEKQFRKFCHNNLRQNRSVGVNAACDVFNRLYANPKAKLERGDFLDQADPKMPQGLADLFWTAFRFGQYPFSRYYLVRTNVWGSIEDQTLTYVMFEYCFAGLFALRRRPKRRVRTITLRIDYIGTHFEKATELWREGVDKNWTGQEFKADKTQLLKAFAPHLGF